MKAFAELFKSIYGHDYPIHVTLNNAYPKAIYY